MVSFLMVSYMEFILNLKLNIFLFQSLPRQTCGLFTKTLNLSTYPKGPNALYESANGGELFWTIVNNPVSISFLGWEHISYHCSICVTPENFGFLMFSGGIETCHSVNPLPYL